MAHHLPQIINNVLFPHKAVSKGYWRAIGVLLIFTAVGTFWFFYRIMLNADFFFVSDLNGPQVYTNNRVYPPLRGEAFVQFEFGIKPVRAFRGSIIDGMSIADVVEQAAVAGNFNIAWHPVPTIDGINDGFEGKHWIFYRNSDHLIESPDSVSVSPGDEIFARFQ